MTRNAEPMRVKFKPWIGLHYGRNSRFGVPVMIVGESHYDWKGRERRCTEKEDVTRFVIRDQIKGAKNGGANHRALRRIAKLFGVSNDIDDERSAFWESVVFLNYVPFLLSRGVRRPSRWMWPHGYEPLVKALEDHRPALVVTFGKAMHDNIVDEGAKKNSDFIRDSTSGRCPKWWATSHMRIKQDVIRFLHLPHPGSRGWPGKKGFCEVLEEQIIFATPPRHARADLVGAGFARTQQKSSEGNCRLR